MCWDNFYENAIDHVGIAEGQPRGIHHTTVR